MNTNRSLASFGICLGIFIVGMDWSIVNSALPAIQNSLSASILELQWMMNIFGVLICTFLVTMGRVSDLYGRKKIFFVGLIIFGLSSLFAGLAPNPLWLIVCRGFQGFSAAILFPGSQGLLIHTYPDHLHGKAIGLWASCAGIALAMGPVLGGLIITFLSWRWIFYINIPVVLLSFLLISRYVRESFSKEHGTKIDYKGAALLVIGMATFVISIVQAPDWGWTSKTFFITVILGASLLILFLYHESKAKVPIIRIDLFWNRMFLASSITNFSIVFVGWSVYFLFPLYLYNILLFPPYVVGLVMACLTVPIAVLAPFVAKIYERYEKAWIHVFVGFLCYSAASLLILEFGLEKNLFPVVISLLFIGLGWVVMWGPAMSSGISSLPKEMATLASGSLATIQESGAAIGLAITGSLFRYMDMKSLDKKLENSRLTIDPAERDYLQSVLSEPEKIKDYAVESGREIFSFLRESFVDGLHSSAILLLSLSILTLFAVLIVLRKKIQKIFQ